jgi:hypothetical protein
MSMKPTSGKNLLTTGSRSASRDETGTQLTETGSARLSTLPRPAHPFCQGDPMTELPTSLRSIVSEPVALLLSWLRFSKKELDPCYARQGIEALTRLEADLVGLTAASEPGQVIAILEAMATVVQVAMPEDIGVKAYVALLQHIPPHVLELAMLEILRSHEYRTMPLPADFLKCGEVTMWKAAEPWLRKMCGEWKRQLQRQLDSAT